MIQPSIKTGCASITTNTCALARWTGTPSNAFPRTSACDPRVTAMRFPTATTTPTNSDVTFHGACQQCCNQRSARTHSSQSSSSVRCTHLAGKCNKINNCADCSDEIGCVTTTHCVEIKAMTGFSATSEAPALHDHLL